MDRASGYKCRAVDAFTEGSGPSDPLNSIQLPAAKADREPQPHSQTRRHHQPQATPSTSPSSEGLTKQPLDTRSTQIWPIREPMQSLRAAASGSRINALALARPSLRSPVTARAFSQSPAVRGGGGDHHYDPPSGWLFGVKPGEQYEKEGWEGLMYWGFGGTCLFAVVAYAFKPDTSIQTWALEEARRRLEAEGILPDPDAKKE